MEEEKLLIQNAKLKVEIQYLYKDWQFDQKRFQEIKDEKKDLEKKYDSLLEKYKDLQADFDEYKNKYEYCESCQA